MPHGHTSPIAAGHRNRPTFGTRQGILPHPFSPGDAAAGYRYELSVLQAEFSLTQTLDSPVNGRIFFEQVIRDNLDIGRPTRPAWSSAAVSSAAASAPPRAGSAPASSPTGSPRACTWTTRTQRSSSITNSGKRSERKPRSTTPVDFGVAKGLSHLPELKEIGFTASRRLLDVQRISHDPADGAAALTALTQPVISKAATRTAGMPVTSLRVQALLAAI